MFFEPPGRDVAFADTTEQRQRRRVAFGVVQSCFCQSCEIASKHLGAGAQGINEEGRQVDFDFSGCNPRSNHPHGLLSLVSTKATVLGIGYMEGTHMAFSTRGSIIDHDALGFEFDDSIVGRGVLFCYIFEWKQPGQGSQFDGEAKKLTAGVILLHGLNYSGED